ncbi:MmgE/PrpD family protein [Paraburkholderia phytofirmans]|jgi:2-methylcitrate dehydratase PrpD|uniref:MmgE/PrpD family protein n=1 Tax=Paraburkholderia sp. BL9I2N2 TaxID=1938809 RepID=UPI00104FAAD0|nr:MmgE/PrpD family protein [Paraburkholderia sp. BL9I2N2]TCK91780.1 2-methylcitrate dehydratase PrpD [Paraburkholderia sp. BL9I2N2]
MAAQADRSISQTDTNSEAGHATRRLAQWIGDTTWRDVPAAVRHEAKRALVNYVAVALAACTDPTLDKAVRNYRRFSAGQSSSVIGRSERVDMLNAAALNAMSANVFDFDDTHIPTIIHPTAPVAAALFAFAESLADSGPHASAMTGEALLLAFVIGVEVECRIGNAVSPEHYQRGWHITSTCGVFGAAAAIAKVLGLSAQQIVWALGNASAQAGGLVETLGTMSKSISVGNAARNGLLSALLAADDFSGPDSPLEGERGFLRVTASKPDADALTRELGHEWALLSNTYKPYPCGVVLNPVIDACLDLRRDARWTLNDVERVELTGHPLLRERTDRPNVRTGRESQVSAQHAVAVTLATGKASLAEFSDSAVTNPALRAFDTRLRFIDDASWPVESAQVVVVLRSGETLSRRIHAARGSLAAPLADVELATKLRELADYGGSGVAPQPLIDALWRFDSATDAAALMRLARAT